MHTLLPLRFPSTTEQDTSRVTPTPTLAHKTPAAISVAQTSWSKENGAPTKRVAQNYTLIVCAAQFTNRQG